MGVSDSVIVSTNLLPDAATQTTKKREFQTKDLAQRLYVYEVGLDDSDAQTIRLQQIVGDKKIWIPFSGAIRLYGKSSYYAVFKNGILSYLNKWEE